MTITTKGRYALRILLDLAQQDPAQIVPLGAIAKRQEISNKYLEMIMGMLHKAGLVKSTRGKNGGYQLARRPEEYTISEILRLTEGNLASVACLEKGTPDCERAAECLTLPLWQELDRMVEEFLGSVTLQDLLQPGGFQGNLRTDGAKK